MPKNDPVHGHMKCEINSRPRHFQCRASQPPCCIQPAMRVRRGNVGAWRAVSCRDLHRVAGLPIGSGTNIENAAHARVAAFKQGKVCSLPCITSAPRDATGVLSRKPPSTVSLPFRAGASSTGTAASAAIRQRRKSSNGVCWIALKCFIAKPEWRGHHGVSLAQHKLVEQTGAEAQGRLPVWAVAGREIGQRQCAVCGLRTCCKQDFATFAAA